VLQIRQADNCDIHGLVDLDDECFDTYYYEKTKFGKLDFQDYLRCKKSILLVAIIEARLVGYVAGTVRASQGRSIAHLDSIAVSSTARQRGSEVSFCISLLKRQNSGLARWLSWRSH